MKTPSRRGATVLETAIVMAFLLFVVFGIIVFGMAVHHGQHVTCLSCEGARFASVRGADYQRDGGNGLTQQQILDQSIKPYAADLDPSKIGVSIEWINQSTGEVKPWDSAKREVRSINANGEYVSNTVRVTVTYTWPSGLFGDFTSRSVTEVPLSY